MSKKETVQEEVQQDAPNAIVVTIKLAEALIGYLKTKPMVEVEAFVGAISQSPGVYFESDVETKE